MTFRDGTVAGVPARVCRISFTGDLNYEVHVDARDGLHVWEALMEAGEPDGITPYGTEAMHVLRAEKGYAIVGQETDGTVTPDDLGMGWIVNPSKGDFLGKRSLVRADTARAGRAQLVGLLPADPALRLAEGAQLVEDDDPARRRSRCSATSRRATAATRSAGRSRSRWSPTAVRGRARRSTPRWPTARRPPCEVADAVLFDPEGSARDG